MKKMLSFLVRFIICGLFTALAAFFSLTLFYRRHFAVNTWINGIYCTGKTVEQVNGELADSSGVSLLEIRGAEGCSGVIRMEAAGIYPDFTRALEDCQKRQAWEFWSVIARPASPLEFGINRFIWDEEKLREAFYSLEFVRLEMQREAGVRVLYDEEAGYRLEDGNADRLDADRAYAYLKSCLARGESVVSLEAGECYGDREDSPQDGEQREIWQKISDFAKRKLVYDMGSEKIPIAYSDLCGFLKKQLREDALPGENGQEKESGAGALHETGKTGTLLPVMDEQGQLLVDEAAVADWVRQLALAYDTCDTERAFLSTRGDVVRVKYGTYGTRINAEAEISYLLGMLRERGEAVEENHVPAYRQQGYARGLDDIGGTYIEVDMTTQHLYFYRDRVLVLDTDVVTGNVSRGMSTPEGIYYVYNKGLDVILRGPGYASPVKYWMAIVGGVGFHDATWRRQFGAQIYQTDGSHGCINMPLDVVSGMYELVEVGTPVILFY